MLAGVARDLISQVVKAEPCSLAAAALRCGAVTALSCLFRRLQRVLTLCHRKRALCCAACAGWPVPPSQQPWCSTCPAGWASTSADAASCQMCMPGSFAAAPQSPACTACGNGTYAYSWGSTHCNHCIIGTYAPKQACLPGVITACDCLTCLMHVCTKAACVQAGSKHFHSPRARKAMALCC